MVALESTRADAAALDTAIEQACCDLYIRALKRFPPDVAAALERAAAEETSPIAARIMRTICENIQVAHERSLSPIERAGAASRTCEATRSPL